MSKKMIREDQNKLTLTWSGGYRELLQQEAKRSLTKVSKSIGKSLNNTNRKPSRKY